MAREMSSDAARLPVLEPVQISSSDMEHSQLLQYWQDHLCRHVIQAHCSTPADHPLFFDLLHYPVPGMGVTWLRDSPQLVTRAKEHVKRATGHHVVIMVQHEGTTLVRCGERDMALNPGDVGLVADWRPSLTTAHAPVAQTVLMVPLEQMRGLLPKSTDLSVMRLDGGHLGTGLVQQVAQTLHQQLKAGTGLGSVNHFQQALLQSVAGACLVQGHMAPSQGSRLDHYYYERMEAFIRANLGSPELAPAAIAATVGLSVSHAQRVYRGFGHSMTRSIRDKRLDAAQRDLLNPGSSSLSVQEIAYHWGFYDAAHFSHAFRKAFGLSPREWRQQHGGQRPTGE